LAVGQLNRQLGSVRATQCTNKNLFSAKFKPEWFELQGQYV